MFSIAANGVLETPKTLAQEIAAIEAQIDAIQEAAIAGIPSLLPGSPQRLQGLVKLFSSTRSCPLIATRHVRSATCRRRATRVLSRILNVSSVATPGSVRTRFALRKPPSAAYAAFSPPLYYAEKPGEGKCSQCFIGGISGTCVQRDCGCTARPQCKRMDRPSRKRKQIEDAASKSPRAKMLKLADKTSNLRAIAASPPADWSVKRRIEYVECARKVAEGLRGVSPKLEEQFDEAAHEAERSFMPAI